MYVIIFIVLKTNKISLMQEIQQDEYTVFLSMIYKGKFANILFVKKFSCQCC